ncbi:hypothetical protein AAE478_003992 [Parahypoxylon ruwenzoriense]
MSGDIRSTISIGSIQPTEVAPARSLPGLEVQCIARTSGLQTARILPALTSVKIFGRTSPSHTYQVSAKCSNFAVHPFPGTEDPLKIYPRSKLSLGVPGDSGAWVIDRPYGRVCGHVLAWSERKQVAYICPMEVLLRDIAETLEAKDVRLPGGRSIISIAECEEEEVVEVSDLDDWSEQGSAVEVGVDEEKLLQLQPAQEADHDAKLKESKRLSSVKREQRASPGGRALSADMDKMHL